ncbi:MAG: hypothetical protein FWH07_05150 [Oscillospiraceae bacterium]|nr:hypothetical protein [Oscillospiraceae bacterium]
MKNYKIPTAIMLAIALIIGVITIPTTTTTATEYEFKVNTDDATTIGFGGKEWSVIGHDGDGVASETDTLTLLLANGQSYGTSAFRTGQSSDPGNGTMKQNTAVYDNWWYANNPSDMDNWNEPREYLGSTLQQRLEAIANELKTSSPKEESLIIPRNLSGGGNNEHLTDVAGPIVENARLWALSSGEAQNVNNTLREFSTRWWLRSPGNRSVYVSFVYVGGDVYVIGNNVYLSYGVGGVRPALQLNLEGALFTSDNTATGGKSATTIGGGFVQLQLSNNIKFTMLDDSLELASVTPTARDGDTITFDYNGATQGKTLSAVVMRDGAVAYYAKLVEDTNENGTGVELTLPDDYNSATDKVQVFVEEVNGVNYTDFASAFAGLGDPCDYGLHKYGVQTDCMVAVNCNDCGLKMIPKKEHVHDLQTDLTKAVYCKVCSFEVFAALPPIEVDIVNDKIEIRNNTNGFFSTKGYYLADGENEWALPVVVFRARSTVVISGGKRIRIGGLSGVDVVWLTDANGNVLGTWDK